jgi:hypothetical protein
MIDHGLLPPGIFDPDSRLYVTELCDTADPALWAGERRFAPIVTPTNARRRMFNFTQAMAFAQQRGVPIVFWLKAFNETALDSISEEQMSDPSSQVHDVFVAGAPAMILTNVVPHLRLSNGTQGKMHSLTWADAATTARNLERISKARPGELVEVDQPLFVNVVIKSQHHLPLRRVDPATGDVLPQRGVQAGDVPGAPQYYLFPMQHWYCREKASQRAGGKVVDCPPCKAHNIELGFSFTYYKVQGDTCDFVILDLNFPMNTSIFASAYVGITRVRQKANLVFLPILEAKHMDWLRRATWDKDLKAWLRGEE